MITILPPGPTCTPRGFGIDPKLSAVPTRAPGRTSVLKPSSKSDLKIALITGSNESLSLSKYLLGCNIL